MLPGCLAEAGEGIGGKTRPDQGCRESLRCTRCNLVFHVEGED